MERKQVICVVGPTASGKSALGVEIATHSRGEVISADSRQVYRGLDIGSGKITTEEMRGIPHHLLDVADPREVFTVSDFVTYGERVMGEITERKRVPIVVGGTGFYIDALLGRTSFPEVPPNTTLRATLENKSAEELAEELRNKDPERFETIDIKNPRRLIRALEIVEALGKNPPRETESPYDVLWIGLSFPSDELHMRIHERFVARLKGGMVDEVQHLLDSGVSKERMEALGLEYRYITRHLSGTLPYEEMIVTLEKEIVQYAKRQMTWFKKNKDIQWFKPNERMSIRALVRNFLP